MCPAATGGRGSGDSGEGSRNRLSGARLHDRSAAGGGSLAFGRMGGRCGTSRNSH